jgi:branched-chain amino acid transport system permease protein
VRLDPRLTANALLLAALALVPVYVAMGGSSFYMSLFTRIVILAIAAVSLNLILGYGGMVSFGHAAYIGIGGYSVGVLASHGIHSGALQWPLAIGLSALFALAIGAISLRTRGVYFIMITLAFGQMVYFLGAGAYAYGGDDGLTIRRRSQFGGLVDLGNKTVFYYLCFLLLLAAIYFCHRLVQSRFGVVLCASRSNDRRMNAIGFPTYRYRLAAFVIAGAVCGLAGVLLANHSDFISPAVMHWTRSGDLIVMVVLGGMGTLFGPLYGTVAFLLLEELMSSHLPKPLNESWQIIFGPMLILVVLFAKGGIDSLLARASQARG